MSKFLGLRGKSLATVISVVCGLCFLCFGYAQGVVGGLLTVPAFLARFPQIDTINNSSARNARLQGITVGTWNLGCFASAILTIFIGDYLGRRKTLMLGLAIWVIGEIVQCTSYSFGQFIAGRFIAGFGNGFTTATVPAYQAECVKSHRKGTILMISAGAFIAAGLALSYWLTFAFAYISNASASWRVPIALQILFAVVAFGLLIFMPESPRWLILTGREDEALKVLAALNDEDIEGPEIRNEFLQIKDAILIMTQGSTSSMRSNGDRRNLHRAILAYFVQVMQQLSGINLVLQYLALIMYTQFTYSGWLARLLGACAATEYFLASFIAVVGIDRFWGRRSLMMFGAAGMCLCMVLLTIMTYLWQEQGVSGTNIAGTVFLFGFSTFFAIGWQGMAWLYQVEVVPLRIRGPANALSTSANWMFNFVVVMIAPIALHNIGYRTYIIFACTNFAIVPLIYFFYPETAYRSLEEVDVLFHLAAQTPNPWLSVVRIAKETPLWFGRKGENPFIYEKSEWHRNHLDFQSSGSTLAQQYEKNNNSPNSDDSHPAAGSIGQAIPVTPSTSPDSNPSPGSGSSPTPILSKTNDKVKRASGSSTPGADRFSHKYNQSQGKSYHSATSSYSDAQSAYNHAQWRESEMAPPPLRVSMHPDTRDSANPPVSQRMLNQSVLSTGDEGAGAPSTAYPRQSMGTGIARTTTGRETYYPDGIEPVTERDGPERPRSTSSNESWSRFPPREAGRSGGWRY
ncbi:hypothetical protein B0J11DRAFT_113492 [Dendryphion nanum]|uniref:Major facilitator superfamily (MFS) profile domain-containing protein n=1 Tax=Dendryphion nanum TaxID=256645 RepID=A0A9P9ICM9_9PLEO|nr:hypothetical protein B0J11DRAFT_113492 [Dendryphion nanum]